MQLSMNFPVAVPKDAYKLGTRTSGEVHGVVLTKPHIVDLILDLVGYTSDRDLGKVRLLEPACGHGAFLVPAVRRLLSAVPAARRHVNQLGGAITAYDIDPAHVEISRQGVADVLKEHGVSAANASRLAEGWIHQRDFLLAGDETRFNVIVGNPPYVRIEQLDPFLQQEYRRRFASLFDRADLYVAFIERGLNLLADDGVLSFVCADRWILNRYGAPLRRLIAERFQVRTYIDLHRASPFESDVIAYPAIFVIGRSRPRGVTVTTLRTASVEECQAVRTALVRPGVSHAGVLARQYEAWFEKDEPWVLSSPEHLAILRDLERRYRPIESGDTRVRIGVATGNDRVYIVGADANIETDRLVPLVMRDDIENGHVRDGHRFVINTFEDDGRVIDLRGYPRLARYFEAHAKEIRARHVAQRNRQNWFRTIDRVYPELARVPKLLIPDIAGSNQVVLEEGRFHPHHNLYFVTSTSWDLAVLGALLSSKVALFFVWSYAVKMRGGYLRFQAQYLRRIRLPSPADLPARLSKALRVAFEQRDFPRIDALALDAYGVRELPAFEFVDTRA